MADFGNRLVAQAELEHLFKLQDGFWIYPGDPIAEIPHAMTREGKCTDLFMNCMSVLEYTNLCEIIADQLIGRLFKVVDPQQIGLVADAAYSGSSDLGQNVARLWGRYCELAVAHRTVEKDANGDPTIFRGVIRGLESVLIVNELMTTSGGSTYMAKEAVAKKGALMDDGSILPVNFLPVVGLFVNRSWEAEELPDGTKIVSLMRYKARTYQPGKETCPFCAVGSKSIKPKVGNNWDAHFKPHIKMTA